MSGTGAVDVVVDLAELDRVRTDLAGLLTQLAGLDGPCAIEVDGDTMGDDVAARAVGWFGDRWRRGRETLSHDVTGCLDHVAGAIDAYQGTEADLSSEVAALAGAAVRVVGGGPDGPR